MEDATGCLHPRLNPSSAYRYGCRCDRCMTARRLWRSGYTQIEKVEPEPRTCEGCGWTFIAINANHVNCSPRCANKRTAPPHASSVSFGPCRVCGALACYRRGSRSSCAGCRPFARREKNRRRNHKRRALLVGDYTIAEVAARDGSRCHLCRRSVNMNLSGSHPRGPTIDHVLPLSLGGVDELPNVSLAHRECNVRKGNRVDVVQLRLVG